MRTHDQIRYLEDSEWRAEIGAHLDAGGDPRVHGNLPVFMAYSRGDLALLDRLLALGLTADDIRSSHEPRRGIYRGWFKFRYVAVFVRLSTLGLAVRDMQVETYLHHSTWEVELRMRLADLGMTEAMLDAVIDSPRMCVTRSDTDVLDMLIRNGLTAADVRAGNYYMLRAAGRFDGYIESFKRLCALVPAADVRANEDIIARYACAHGAVSVLEVIVGLGLTVDDVRARNNEMLRIACLCGQFRVVDMLVGLGLTADDARALDSWAMRMACECDCYAVVAQLLALGLAPTALSISALSRCERLRRGRQYRAPHREPSRENSVKMQRLLYGVEEVIDLGFHPLWPIINRESDIRPDTISYHWWVYAECYEEDDDDLMVDYITSALAVWGDTPELEAAEAGLTEAEAVAWEVVCSGCVPCKLRFSD